MPELVNMKINSDFSVRHSTSVIGGDMQQHEHRHFHEDFEIVFFVKANLDVFIKDKQYKIKDGDILFVYEHDIHNFIYGENGQYERYVLLFKKNYISSLIKSLGIEMLFEQLASAYRKVSTDLKQRIKIRQLFDEILEADREQILDKSALSGAEAKLLLGDIIIHFIKLARENSHKPDVRKKDSQVLRILEYIDRNYMNSLSLDLLEKEFYMDKFHISHIFKDITGFSVVDYIRHKRVREAQKMLGSTSKELTDICFDCGFNNIQHFHRVFKEIAGTTPARYRKSRV